jgi:UDP-N-acetylglucosamine--N-acetylmuramyl-(pentapeptide) pyrophosphoryl-undecaprenol N-acetylglucosamine transferase
MPRKIKIAFTGGGTGGHLSPIVAIARELRRLYGKDDLLLHYIGPNEPGGLALLSQENIQLHPIVTGKIRRYFSLENISDVLFKIPFGFLQSFFILLFLRPKLLFSKGGSGSVVVCFCSYILGIPLFLHESDIVPGLSNTLAAKWAQKVFISFPKTEYFNLSRTILTGNPTKKELTEGDVIKAQEALNLTLKKPVILFMGGSQGAVAINDFVLIILNDLLKDYEVIHVCGLKNYQQTQAESQVILNPNLAPYYHLYGSLTEIQLKHAYKAAGLIVSRGGSGSIFEIAACGKPSILVPLPSAAGNHQYKNTYAYAANGAAIIMEQENLTPNFFIGKVNYLFSNPDEMEKMQQAALQFAKPYAARSVAIEILDYLHVN